MEARLNALIGDIYEAALDEAALRRVAGGLANIVDGCSTVLAVDGGAVLTFSGVPEDAMAAWSGRFHALDPWIALGRNLPLGEFVDTEPLLPVSALEATAFYHEFLRPIVRLDVVRLAGSRLMLLDERPVFLGILRERGQGSFDPAGVAAMGSVMPHLRRLVSLRWRLSSDGRVTSPADTTLDALALPVLRVDRSGRALWANAAAERLFAEKDGLLFVRGRQIDAQYKDDSVRLADALLRASEGQGGSVAISRPSGRRALAVIANPLPAEYALSPGEALLFISDPERRAPALVERLRHLFGLTAAEAEVAVALGHGQDIPEISAARQVKVSTLRDQISSILAKTGTGRQAQLAALIGRLAALG